MTRENLDRIQICLCRKAIGKRRNIAVRQIDFNPFNAMHGKEHNRRRERISFLHHRYKIVERCQLNSAQAQAFKRKSQNRAPEFFSWIAESSNHHAPRMKWILSNRRRRWLPDLHNADCRRLEAIFATRSAALKAFRPKVAGAALIGLVKLPREQFRNRLL